jgi:hypothetical protein
MVRVSFLSVMVLAASVAWAGKKTVIIAGGDCADPSLISGAKDFRDASTRLLGAQLMEAEVVLDIVRPRATRSLQDIDRQLDSARALFYGGQTDRAEALVDRALEELERASPDTKPWPSTQNALVLKALIAKSFDRPKDMADAFRRIVRVDPGFKLDPDAHPPSAIAALEAVKKELSRVRKAPILVRVDAGPIATVYVDGQPMGTTPLKLDLVPGTYRVALVSGSMVSFPHRVDSPRDLKLGVDLAFEGSISTQAPLCLSGTVDAPAIKLSQLVAAENVIVLRNVARRGEPAYLSGTLYDLSTGQQERAGSVQLELIPNLATFLVTGKEMSGVQHPGEPMKVSSVPPPLPAPEPVAKVEPAAPVDDAPRPIVLTPRALAPVVDVKPEATPSTGRVVSYVVIGVGVAALVAGAIVYSAGAIDREALAAIAPGDTLPSQTTRSGPEALALMTRVDANSNLAFATIGGGAGAVLGGVLGAVLFPASTTKVSVAPTPTGASLGVAGSF